MIEVYIEKHLVENRCKQTTSIFEIEIIQSHVSLVFKLNGCKCSGFLGGIDIVVGKDYSCSLDNTGNMA